MGDIGKKISDFFSGLMPKDEEPPTPAAPAEDARGHVALAHSHPPPHPSPPVHAATRTFLTTAWRACDLRKELKKLVLSKVWCGEGSCVRFAELHYLVLK